MSSIDAAPILGLIPAATTTLHPRLQVFGQPDLGHTLRMKVTRADPSGDVFLFYSLLPGTGSHQGCSLHVDPSNPWMYSMTSAFSEANFDWAIPLDPAWLFSEWFFQALTLPGDRLSNGIVLRIGGGL